MTAAAHCDDADFLTGPYPRTPQQAADELAACLQHLRGRFHQGIGGAENILDSANNIVASEVSLDQDCTFFGGVPGRAKCNSIEGLGRALHGAQDFYSHSNWADESDPAQPIGPSNPPGLNLPGPSSFLDLSGSGTPVVPPGLSTGCFRIPDVDPGVPIIGCGARVTHAALNKDLGLIDPVTETTSGPTTKRGMVKSNFAKAVTGAIVETRRQWSDFRNALVARYGVTRASLRICAITHDDPVRDCAV